MTSRHVFVAAVALFALAPVHAAADCFEIPPLPRGLMLYEDGASLSFLPDPADLGRGTYISKYTKILNVMKLGCKFDPKAKPAKIEWPSVEHKICDGARIVLGEQTCVVETIKSATLEELPDVVTVVKIEKDGRVGLSVSAWMVGLPQRGH